MSRAKLDRLPAITFYKDELTASRRDAPVPQLVCIGNPCKKYSPPAVRCERIGGSGLSVDWECKADLPETLRFGRVEVGCEGWSGPGDEYVLKGSCALEYRLVHIPTDIQGSRRPTHHVQDLAKSVDLPSTLFTLLWIGVLVLIGYSFLKSCLGRQAGNTLGRPPGQGPPRPPPFGNAYPRDPNSDETIDPRPPPYSKTPTPGAAPAAGWRPGFWTGAALAGLGAQLLPNLRRRVQEPRTRTRTETYDWETEQPAPLRRSRFDDDDRGEGSSRMGGGGGSGYGAMRSATGLGGSNVR